MSTGQETNLPSDLERGNVISFQGCFYYLNTLEKIAVPFAEPMQKDEIFVESCLLRRTLRNKIRALDKENVRACSTTLLVYA